MSCEGYGLLISKWVDGEAKPDEVRRVEAHVAACGACRKLADEFRRNAGLLESALGPEPFGQRVAGSVFSTLVRREALVRWGGRLAVAAAILVAFGVMRADRDAEWRRMTEQYQASLKVVQEMERTMAQERSRRIEIVRVSESPFPREDGVKVAVTPEGPGTHPELVAHHDPEPTKHVVPPPGTYAMDRVNGEGTFETGAVALTWRMDRAPGAVWFVYRRPEGTEDWGTPLNDLPLTEPKYDDATAHGSTTYEYGIVALSFGVPRVADEIARVRTAPDLHVEFKGLGSGADLAAGMFGVRVRLGGKWSEATFQVRAGEAIGGLRGGIDYSTGTVFHEASQAVEPRTHLKQLRAEIETPSGSFWIWNGTGATGTQGRLEIDELAR